MCGIGGFRRFGDEPIKREQIEIMLTTLQMRGVDASGIAIMNPGGELVILKDDRPAFQFIQQPAFDKFLKEHLRPDTLTVIVHTRAATHGNPRDNNNNHPMFHNNAAVVHNGVISNHQFLFENMGLDRHAETDSDILRAIVDKDGLSKASIRHIARCVGSVAMIAISPSQPDHILMVRSGSPLVLAEAGNILVFASEKQYIQKSMRRWVDKWGVSFSAQNTGLNFLNMRDNSAWLWGPSGLEWHDACQTSMTYREPTRAIFDNFKDRQARWDAEEAAKRSRPKGSAGGLVRDNGRLLRMRCPKCEQWNKFTDAQKSIDLADLFCGNCHVCLGEEKPLVH